MYNKYTNPASGELHSLHVVSFHISQDFGNLKAQERWDYYSLEGAPSSVYDGGYKTRHYTDESMIYAAGTRQVHKLEIYLAKSIEGSTLNVSGNVTNLESQVFNGFILVFITENQLVDSTYNTTWNFVFRDYGLNKTLSLMGLTTDAFNCTWSIPNYVKAASIQVVAGVFEREPAHSWPYTVQSVCDVCGHSGKSISLPADLNKDGIVNILDVTIVAAAYNTKPGDPRWNAAADLDKNGTVNILDVTMVAKDYGKTV